MNQLLVDADKLFLLSSKGAQQFSTNVAPRSFLERRLQFCMKVFLRLFTMVFQVITRSHKFLFNVAFLQRMNFSYLTIRLFARDFYHVIFDKSPNEQSRIEIESELSISCF